MLIAVVVAEKQIKLEDIERDNLLSERRANKQEVLKTDQTQHSRTPDSQSYEVSFFSLISFHRREFRIL